MTIEYTCKKCNFYCNSKNDMKRHLNRKKKCTAASIEQFDITDEENYKESLNPNHSFEEDILKTGVHCEHCNKYFATKKFLPMHLEKYCKKREEPIIKEPHVNEEKPNIMIEINNNIENQNITINNVINFNPVLNINIQDFKEDWKTDHITDMVKKVVFMCQNKFSSFLTEVLKNNENNNVVIDKNSLNGYVYNKETMEFEEKDKDYIIEETVEKIKNHLLDLSNEVVKEPYKIEMSDVQKAVRDINTKYKKYKGSSKKKKQEINNIFTNIYDTNKTDTIKNYKKIKNEPINM